MTQTVLIPAPLGRLPVVLALAVGIGATPACGGTTKADDEAAGAESTVQTEESRPDSSTLTTGSGQPYETIVQRETEGELSPEDFRQASLLTSRIVSHLNSATQHLADEEADAAREELKKGLTLVRVVRELLPTTVVTTVVQDPTGAEVYKAVDRIQDDRIPLFQGLVAVKVVEPIAEAKEEAAKLKGLRLADADLLDTSLHVELAYVERKLEAALRLLGDEPTDALDQLVLAQTQGITVDVNERDDPLMKAQLALQLAERMVKRERPEAAKANLQLAWNHLEVYRGLIAEEEDEDVREVADAVSHLVENLEAEEAAAEQIRSLWDQVADMVSKSPGEMRATWTTTDEPEEPRRES